MKKLNLLWILNSVSQKYKYRYLKLYLYLISFFFSFLNEKSFFKSDICQANFFKVFYFLYLMLSDKYVKDDKLSKIPENPVRSYELWLIYNIKSY